MRFAAGTSALRWPFELNVDPAAHGVDDAGELD
jgi:hypothetical protein